MFYYITFLIYYLKKFNYNIKVFKLFFFSQRFTHTNRNISILIKKKLKLLCVLEIIFVLGYDMYFFFYLPTFSLAAGLQSLKKNYTFYSKLTPLSLNKK